MTSFNLLQGDALERLKELPDNSIDSIVTDPPYGLSKQPDMLEVLQNWLAGDDYKHNGKGFMGKAWDSFVPGPSIWKECLRVLKPGGHMVAFFGTRTYDLGVVAIRIAGFEIRDQIAWVYGSGFPKSMDVSKALDAQVLTGGSHSRNIKDAISQRPGKSRETATLPNNGVMSGDRRGGVTNDNVATDAAKQWEGWGTALKPAFEPIVLARKPVNTTIAKNVLEYGVGGINIDGCRVQTSENLNGGAYAKNGNRSNLASDDRLGDAAGMFQPGKTAENDYEQPTGRFPANLIHDGSDEVVSLFPDSKGQLAPVKGTEKSHTGHTGIYGTFARTSFDKREEDETSSARFFYCAKASKRDRNDGLDHFPTVTADPYGQHRGRRMESNDTRFDGKQPSVGKNNHPTVKPTTLMEYLCRLVTPPGGTILDPFMGSGSTGKAAMYEGFNFIGIELLEEHMEIAEARIQAAKKDAYEISIGHKQPKAKKNEVSQESDVDITKFFG